MLQVCAAYQGVKNVGRERSCCRTFVHWLLFKVPTTGAEIHPHGSEPPVSGIAHPGGILPTRSAAVLKPNKYGVSDVKIATPLT